MKIVIVGGVGSGKSTVSSLLHGCLMGDCVLQDVDQIVRDIYACPEDYFTENELARWDEIRAGGPLRDRIFTDPELRKEVEDLTTPYVKKRMNEEPELTYNIIEFPLFFEKTSIQEAGSYDVIIRVHAPEDLRRNRCIVRGWSTEVVNGVFNAQFTDAQRDTQLGLIRIAHSRTLLFTVDSTQSMAEMRSSVYEIANFLKQTQLNRTRTIKTKIGVFGGSFDPITLGHEHVVREAVKLMDYVIIAIALNPTKKHRFTQEGRRRMVLSAIANLNTDRSKVILLEVPENELLASWAYKLGANTLFRGIRTGTDLENEQTIQFVQNKVAPNMSMVHILPPRDLLEVSSSLIRNSLHLRDWELIVNGYVSRGVFNYIEENRNVD